MTTFAKPRKSCMEGSAMPRQSAAGPRRPILSAALAKVRPHLTVEIVKRSDRTNGFAVLPKRWIVERTLAWLNRCRRLAKDWENRNRKALAFLHLASMRLMLRKLCNPAYSLRTNSNSVDMDASFTILGILTMQRKLCRWRDTSTLLSLKEDFDLHTQAERG